MSRPVSKGASWSASLLAFAHVRMIAFPLEVPMNAITITLSDDRLAQLQEMAARLRVSPEELVRVGVEELLARPDDAFQRAVTEVLKKNAELYRRFALWAPSPTIPGERYYPYKKSHAGAECLR